MKEYKCFKYPEKSDLVEGGSQARNSGMYFSTVHVYLGETAYNTEINGDDLTEEKLEEACKAYIDYLYNLFCGETIALSIEGLPVVDDEDDEDELADEIDDEDEYKCDPVNSRAARRHSDKFEATRYKRKRNNDKKYF